MYQDAHLHIAEDAQLNISAKIGRIFLNSISSSDYSAVTGTVEFDQDNTAVIPFFGLHPWLVENESISGSILKNTLRSFSYAGIGECGLDFRPQFKKSRDLQITALEKQLEIAVDLNRPVSIHCVKAWEQLFKSLARFTPFKAPFILHSFYGAQETAARLIELGGFISLSAISLRNPEKSSNVITSIPDDRLLIETDCISGNKKYTVDKHMKILENNYKKISEIRNISEEKLISIVWDNGTIFTN